MLFDDEEDNIVSTDIYVSQRNFNDVDPTDDVECYITRYDQPQIQERGYDNYGPWSDNAHLVFDVPRLPEREW
jgi:hypothetical protein